MKPLSLYILLLCILVCFGGCCTKITGPDAIAAVAKEAGPTDDSHTPLSLIPEFRIKNSSASFNRIGTPKAVKTTAGKPEIVVDSTVSTLFIEEDHFQTTKGSYTNLIYRAHFEKVPLGLNCLNLTTGNNPGLLIIYTLDTSGKVVLLTTVHSCGCYLAFIPTTALSEDAFPEDWNVNRQNVYGYSLPSLIPQPGTEANSRYRFVIEEQTHRISDVLLAEKNSDSEKEWIPLRIEPMAGLYTLPFNGSSVSFFEDKGRREGYVKNNTKILERLLISWWAFDLHVGEDKAYGPSDTSPIPFYTSLKFWQRHSSDMKDFPAFLSYWGWKL